ncbi:hypothetical protein AAHA92_28134 [Salvia divinorum]|uniref:F-box domain-containing protein n=1 Tax=Salvia divinorum TaxID=28513 RepID=A0ABD1FU27_SALDI
MINDVLPDILMHLPVHSLLRFRAVCKFWRDSIDSRSFRKLHTRNNNKSRDMIYLQLCQPRTRKQDKECLKVRLGTKELSMRLQHKGNNKSYGSDHFTSYLKSYWPCHVVVGAVKGLICINPYNFKLHIAICNPFLGQLKILPSSSNPSCKIVLREVAISFDEDGDYKVVQLQSCKKHHCLHAQMYSRRTDSWRELAGDNRALKVKLPWLDIFSSSIFEEDELSFRCFDFTDYGLNALVNIYEMICDQENELRWNYVMTVKVPNSDSDQVPLWRNDRVIFENGVGTFVYDLRARTFISKYSGLPKGSEMVEYRGSFVSLEN